MKRTYTLTIAVDEQIAEEYNKLAADYQNLSPQEYQDFDFLTDAILDANSLLVPADDTSTIHWLPVNGTVPPEKNKRYLVLCNTGLAFAYQDFAGRWMEGYDFIWPSHYAKLPTFTPAQAIPYHTQEEDQDEMLRVLYPDRY